MKSKVKSVLKVLLIAVIINVIVLGVTIVAIIFALDENKTRKAAEEAEKKEQYHEEFVKAMEQSYGLTEGGYTITDESYGEKAERAVITFRVGDKDYTAVVEGSGFTSDYCTDAFRAAVEERITAVLEKAEMLQGLQYRLVSVDFGYHYETILPEGKSLLPKWVNSERIEQFRKGEENKNSWKADQTLLDAMTYISFVVEISPGETARFTKEQFLALNEDLYFVTNAEVRGSETYEYWPSEGILKVNGSKIE